MLDFSLYLRALFALIAVLALIGVVAFLLRRFGADRFKVTRGKKRLSVVEVATIDSRRRLILVRRDSVEHLLLIGGPNDIALESSPALLESEIGLNDAEPAAKSLIERRVPTFTGK